MNAIFREYQEADYEQCESLTNEAWNFDEIFSPQSFSNLAKRMYTKGSVVTQNYSCVVEVDRQVVGFIFGLNENERKPGGKIIFGLTNLWHLLRIKFDDPDDRKKLMNAAATHSKNRASLIKSGKSEILLFVVSPKHQGLGYGTTLWSGFKSNCTDSGVKSIFVETNKSGASTFYEQLGFAPKANFNSPLHEYATKGGQACVLEYQCQGPTKEQHLNA